MKKTAIKKNLPSGSRKSESAERQVKRKIEKAYGDVRTICANTDCRLRKKKGCSGFEGCPGFMSR